MKLSAINIFKSTDRVNFDKIKYTEVYDKLKPCKSTLENYAKHNKLNIDFIPNKDDAKLLDITVSDAGFAGYLKLSKSINNDFEKVKTVKVNDKLISDDTFLKRVYRAVSDMGKKIEDTNNKHLLDFITSQAYQTIHKSIDNSLMML